MAEGTLTAQYRDVLNDMIADARDRTVPLDPALGRSQIGMSMWSAYEKRVLFGALERYGTGNYPKLVSAVRTKSQHEVQVYLSLLQEGLAAQNSSSPHKCIRLNDVPAAIEVTEDCETALNAAADTLSSLVEKHEQIEARTKLGDDWLIDEEVADAEDQTYELALASETEVIDDDVSVADAESTSSDRTNLLRSAAFLQLSKHLFMNNSEYQELNWHYIDPITDASNEPTMFRRAKDDLHALAISLTSRLVQASIFQAMTRLRANDSSRADWTPLAAVRETDVRSAMQVLNMGPVWHHYWARVARRCRVLVFSDSKKYRDGRPGTKSGLPLSYEEVEAELDLEGIVAQAGSEHDNSRAVNGTDQADFVADSDAYTDISEDDSDSGDDTEDGRPAMQGFNSTRKRRRPLSSESFARIEDESVEHQDQSRSAQEQIRLWQCLHIEPPQSVIDASVASQQPLPAQAGTDFALNVTGWREVLVYQSAWEHESGTPDVRDFEDMAARGCIGQKRRRVCQDPSSGTLHPEEDGLFNDDSSQLAEPSKVKNLVADGHGSTETQIDSEIDGRSD